jgi:hypothetical protein
LGSIIKVDILHHSVTLKRGLNAASLCGNRDVLAAREVNLERRHTAVQQVAAVLGDIEPGYVVVAICCNLPSPAGVARFEAEPSTVL